MKIHHSLSHGVSIAKETSTCVNCGNIFEYYPSNSDGKICSGCGKDSENWNQSMQIIRDEPFNNFGSNKSKGKDGPSYQRKRIRQIKSCCSCSKCGYEDDGRALQFHHKYGEKDSSIPEMVNSSNTWDVLLDELRKCDILCANCHIIEHTSSSW
jgi:DNA-directed RNA polymerase subunit M/transcription elongation factor TFIIS